MSIAKVYLCRLQAQNCLTGLCCSEFCKALCLRSFTVRFVHCRPWPQGCKARHARHTDAVHARHTDAVPTPLQLPYTAICARRCALPIRYFQRRQQHPAVHSLTTEVAKTLLQTFVSCHLRLLQLTAVWCVWRPNSEVMINRNAAARLITGARHCDHITHVLGQLHWLPVRRRVEYKVACLVR